MLCVSCKKTEETRETKPVTTEATSADTADPQADKVIAQKRIGGDPDARPNALALTIEAVHENQQPTDKPPWYVAGGKWTYLDLKTPGGATFTVGLVVDRVLDMDPPLTLYSVRALAAGREQGERVVAELARALHTQAPPTAPSGKAPELRPLAMVASQLGPESRRNSDGSFSGAGTWRATKWTSERGNHAAEIYFNYSLAEKRAELSEKDSNYNSDIVADLALALRDGGLDENGK